MLLTLLLQNRHYKNQRVRRRRAQATLWCTHVVGTGVSLQNGSEEASGEGEAGHPEDGRGVRGGRPLGQLVHAAYQVTSPGCKRLHRVVGLQDSSQYKIAQSCVTKWLQPLHRGFFYIQVTSHVRVCKVLVKLPKLIPTYIWLAGLFVTWPGRWLLFTAKSFDMLPMEEDTAPLRTRQMFTLPCGSISGSCGTHPIPAARREIKTRDVLLQQAAQRSGCGQPTVLISRTEVTQDVFAKLAFNKSVKLHQKWP